MENSVVERVPIKSEREREERFSLDILAKMVCVGPDDGRG